MKDSLVLSVITFCLITKGNNTKPTVKAVLEIVLIVLPLPNWVLSPNAPSFTIGGRFAKAAATKKYRRIAKEAVEDEQISTGPWVKVRVKATFFHKDKRRRDSDNYSNSIKAAYDGIVDAELAVDDDHIHMKKDEPVFAVDKEFPRVELEIINISEQK